MRNVVTIMATLEGDLFRHAIGHCLRFGESLSTTGDPQDTPPGRDNCMIFSDSPCVKDRHALHGVAFQTMDRKTILVGARIAAGGHYYTDSMIVMPFDTQLVEPMFDDRFDHVEQIRLEQGQHHLGFRITHPSVEFEYIRDLLDDHQSGV